MSSIFRIGIATLVLITGNLAAAPALVAPGEWEITITPALPTAGAPMTAIVCITKEEADKLTQPPKGKDKDQCKAVNGALSGASLSHVVKCNDGRTTSTQITFAGDRYDGVFELTADGLHVRQKYTAKRLGECADPPVVLPTP